jgi:PKD repeat protein
MRGTPRIATILTLLAALAAGALGSSARAGIAPTRFLPGDEAIGLAPGDQSGVSIAKGTDSSLVVWSDARSLAPIGTYEGETSKDIYGIRVASDGRLLDAVPFVITQARANQEVPRVAWNGTDWLVVFESYMLGGTGYYYQKSLAAVRVAADGRVLDPEPIPIFGVMPSAGLWALASDGDNWVVAFEGCSSGYDVMALRISAAGVVLDPTNRSLVPATYYTRSNLHLAYANGVFLVTFDDAYVGGTFDTKAVRFDRNLTLLDATPISLLSVPLEALAANGSEFYAVWHQQQPNYTMAVTGSRISTAGVKLDGTGKNISGNNQPTAYSTTSVVWDGSQWRVTWGFNGTVSLARVSAAGQVLDPGGISVPGLTPGPTAATSAGGVQIGWVTYASSNNDVFTANISSGNTAGPSRMLSTGAPQQMRPDFAAGSDGTMAVYRSTTASTSRVMAIPLDADGNPLLFEPIELDSGDALNGPGAPAVAWNGSLYMAVWANSSGVVARRLLSDGTVLDPFPIVVMAPAFGPPDVAAMGDVFLVVGLKFGYNVEVINPVGARVRGSDGVVLDTSARVIGGSYSSKPRVAVVGTRWFVIWQQNATHDNPSASTNSVFVSSDGTTAAGPSIYSYYTSGGNGIFDLALASSGGAALTVQSAEVSSGVETDLVARIVNADGTMQPAFNLTPWIGNQYRPRAAWDGSQFVVVYQDQKTRFADWTLDQLDARSDLFGMRIGVTGTILDPQGFAFSTLASSETHPSVEARNGVTLISGAIHRESPFGDYRIGYGLFGTGANPWPVVLAAASPASADIPVTVAFSSAGSSDPGGSIASYLWDFGDGFTSTEANPSHTYNTPGPFVANVTGTDQGGASTTQTVLVNVLAPNQIPVAAATAVPATGQAPLDVVFYATGSYDPDGFLGNFYWTFGDGWDYWGNTAYHTFDHAGTFLVTLTAYDGRGGAGSTTTTVTVTGPNQKPVVVASANPLSGEPPLLVTFDSTGSYDPDGTITSYLWTFGDGGTSTLPNPTHTYASVGSYTASLKVTDDLGAFATKTLTITVGSGSCNGTCLRSTDITLSAKVRGTITVNAKVTVKNDLNVTIPGVTVSATWTLPGGTQQTRTAVTNNRGIATFSTSGTSGTYTITITGLAKTGYTFDAAGSVLSKSITR